MTTVLAGAATPLLMLTLAALVRAPATCPPKPVQ